MTIKKITAEDLLSQKIFYGFLLFHFVLWILTPTFIHQNPPTDSLEGIAWGDLFLWGYEKHPFLAPWLTAFATNLFGVVGWPIYLLGQLAVCICFWAIWRLARRFLPPWHALVAVLLLDGISYYNLQSDIFNPNVLMLPLWALLMLAFYDAVLQQKIKNWLLVGLFAGLAFVCKYQSVLLFFLLFLLLILTPEGRKSWCRPGLYLSLLLALLIISPNLYWLMSHDFVAVNYAVNEMRYNASRLEQPFKFLLAQCGNILPMFFLYLPFWQRKRTQIELTSFQWRFLLLLSIGPLAFTLLFSLLAKATLVSRWGFPFFSLLGVLWVAWRNPVIQLKSLKIFVVVIICFNFLLCGLGFIAVETLPFIAKKRSNPNMLTSAYFPGEAIADTVTQKWRVKYHRPLAFIAGDRNIVVNISAFSPDKPTPFFNWNLQESPWIDLKVLTQKGAVFVHRLGHSFMDQEILQILHQRFPALVDEEVLSFAWQTKVKQEPIRIWVGYLAPGGKIMSSPPPRG